MDYATNVMNKTVRNINTDEVDIMPVNTGVLLHFYDENPYRTIETTETGLIVGIESTKKYRSNETGEIESNEEMVSCAKVIAVGPECKNVKVGEDVYCMRFRAIPVPFRKKGYYIMSEQNITCRIIKNGYDK
ncbi:MAG: hypothetical protein J6V44_11835 [Methanobrevibacter sp.]|nr:hypothetical protein [Methanobrevibacter sp.]